MSTENITIPPETARHVLWVFGHRGGRRPETFTQKLLDALVHADLMDTAKLAAAFPAEVEAVKLAKYIENGVERLQQIAGVTP
ncbi:hypothetical protein ACIOUE_00750 [Streptomyces xanthochromogenes]|uniref:hypothetical protein n=1 Tax=Streptomyces xanthochromogenes TaxID=67384 RepID=UPI00382191F7